MPWLPGGSVSGWVKSTVTSLPFAEAVPAPAGWMAIALASGFSDRPVGSGSVSCAFVHPPLPTFVQVIVMV